MAKEKVLPLVKARANLSEIVDQVNKRGEAFVIAKRQKAVAVLVGIERYREMENASKNLKNFRGKRILKLRAMAASTGDIDQAIADLRKSRTEFLTASLRK